MANVQSTEIVKCIRCGRKLYTAESRKRGYGPKCRKIMLAAAARMLKIYTRAQVQKAATALRNGTVRFVRDGMYECDSSNGRDVYYATAYECTCPSRVRCYHRCAINIREITRVAWRKAKR